MDTKMTRAGIAVILAAWIGFPAAAADFSNARGFKDACVAGSLLDASHVPYSTVVIGHGEEKTAACRYEVGGSEYVYTPAGSAQIDIDRLVTGSIPRKAMLQESDGGRDLSNGCLVFAACAYARNLHDKHIVWEGIIAAQIIHLENFNDGAADYGLNGHAIVAFENDKREIFIQAGGNEPEKIDELTRLAQKGDKSWHNASTLIFYDHHLQALTSFLDQSGTPR